MSQVFRNRTGNPLTVAGGSLATVLTRHARVYGLYNLGPPVSEVTMADAKEHSLSRVGFFFFFKSLLKYRCIPM